VQASSECQLGVVTREDIENLVEEVPGIALRLCRAMSRRLAEMNRS
jgi:CRP-like cAMP-binding protein